MHSITRRRHDAADSKNDGKKHISASRCCHFSQCTLLIYVFKFKVQKKKLKFKLKLWTFNAISQPFAYFHTENEGKTDQSLRLPKSIRKAFVLSQKEASFSAAFERLRHALAGSSGQLFLCHCDVFAARVKLMFCSCGSPSAILSCSCILVFLVCFILIL